MTRISDEELVELERKRNECCECTASRIAAYDALPHLLAELRQLRAIAEAADRAGGDYGFEEPWLKELERAIAAWKGTK